MTMKKLCCPHCGNPHLFMTNSRAGSRSTFYLKGENILLERKDIVGRGWMGFHCYNCNKGFTIYHRVNNLKELFLAGDKETLREIDQITCGQVAKDDLDLYRFIEHNPNCTAFDIADKLNFKSVGSVNYKMSSWESWNVVVIDRTGRRNRHKTTDSLDHFLIE